MELDEAAFKTELETKSRYNTTVINGDNAGTTALLSELEPNKKTFVTATVDEVKEAIGDGIRSLSAQQIQALRFIVDSGGGVVDFSVPAIRQELGQIFSGQPAVVTRLTDLASRPRTWGEAFGRQPTLNDVRKAVAQINKAHINK